MISRNYTLKVTRKQPFIDFLTLEHRAKVTGVSIKDAQSERVVNVPISRQIELRRIHPYGGFRTEPGVEGIFEYYPLKKKNPDKSSKHLSGKSEKQQFSINPLGFRSPSLPEKKGKDTVRIAMLGGSAVWLGSDNDKTVVAQLAKLLAGDGYEVEYINAGVVAAVSSQELSILVQDIVDFDVDLVISFNGFNDIMTLLKFNARIGWPMLPPSKMPNLRYYYPAVPPTANVKPEKLTLAVEHYLNVIDKMSTICKAFDIEYIAAIQPAEFYVEQIDTIDDTMQSPSVAFYQAAISAFKERDKTRVNGGHYISLADLIDLEQYWDPVHFGDEGNRIVAKELYKVIKDRRILNIK